jgi:hypothetical protein
MTQTQFRVLGAKIIHHEHTANDPVKQVYWFKHYTRLISLIRNQGA